MTEDGDNSPPPRRVVDVPGLLGSYDVLPSRQPPTQLEELVESLRQERDRLRLENEELRAEQGTLQQRQRLEVLGTLAGSLAHDFNNLLTSIAGHAELLIGTVQGTGAAVQSAHEVLETAGRAAKLTRQLLAFSRHQVLRPEPVDLNDVVAEALPSLRLILVGDVELATDLSPGLGIVQADRAELEQALLSLVVNAREALPDGGRIGIRTENVAPARSPNGRLPDDADGPHVRLVVSDDGVGMDAETMMHMFDPYFSRKRDCSGAGLGLSAVYGFVKQSGGFVRATSEPGCGTSLEICLPRSMETVPADEPPATSGGTPRTGGTILLAEDEETVRSLCEQVLVAAGYQVLLAGDGREALDVAAAYPGTIDLLLTDVVMPKLSGPAVARELRDSRPGLQVLCMSGYPEDLDEFHGPDQERLPFIAKPFRLDQFLQRVVSILA